MSLPRAIRAVRCLRFAGLLICTQGRAAAAAHAGQQQPSKTDGTAASLLARR